MALEREGKIVAGVVYNPILNDLYVAERGSGAFLNDRRLRVSARKDLADALIGFGMPHLGNLDARDVDATSDLKARIAAVRCTGSAALELAWIAAGRYDGYWHYRLDPWDFAAGALIVREAGGFVTDLAGNERNLATGPIVAGNQLIHRQLRELLPPMPER